MGVATRHGKTPLLRDVLGGPGGLALRTVPVDTDRFGTFTGDRPRPGTAEQVVVAKAAAGAREGRLALGAASEGSFGPDPALPLLVVQHELVALVDLRTGVAVVGRASATADWAVGFEIGPHEPVREAVARLSAHLGPAAPALVVRPEPLTSVADAVTGEHDRARLPGVSKGVVSPRQLLEAITRARGAPPTGAVRVESDLRAHVCPPRRPLIRRAAQDLARRLARLCTACGSPGTGPIDVVRGLPCRCCGTPTDASVAVVDACPACGHRTTRGTSPATIADPARCPSCNP